MKGNEMSGVGNHNTAEFWDYDTRIARRWNVDPVIKIDLSTYSVLSGSPIWKIDPLGDDDFFNKNGKLLLRINNDRNVNKIQIINSTEKEFFEAVNFAKESMVNQI